MNTETMTVHKALVELKTLEKRIDGKIKEIRFCHPKKHSSNKLNGISVEDYIAQTRDQYKSVMTMINRRNAIKMAITESNAKTMVRVGDMEYPVAIAIYIKDRGMDNYLQIMSTMSLHMDHCTRVCDSENGDKLDARAEAHIQSIYGKIEGKNVSDDVKRAREDFVEAQTYEIVDPIGITKEMSRIQDMVDRFMVDVDSALSVSNALTTITFSYETA